MSIAEWISTIQLVVTTGGLTVIAINRWVGTRESTETKIARDLAETDRRLTDRLDRFEGTFKQFAATSEQRHLTYGERSRAIDEHLDHVDRRVVTVEAVLAEMRRQRERAR